MATVYLRYDDYIDNRNHQDALLKDEFMRVHQSIDHLRSDVDQVKSDLDEVKSDLHEFKTETKATFIELKAQIMQTNAYMRNTNLHNPILPIHPVIAFDPLVGIKRPQRFPRHAKEFYLLRHPAHPDQIKMLVYLVEFYDLLPPLTTKTASRPPPAQSRPIQPPMTTMFLFEIQIPWSQG
ncbi:hypothetical protein F5Y16DRAFT_112313 [Xylariaceae sp. FL0255]|nr:hypothetical protein F5Y16DRAFT_112313 [Xylariaceae sp. FL0255]